MATSVPARVRTERLQYAAGVYTATAPIVLARLRDGTNQPAETLFGADRGATTLIAPSDCGDDAGAFIRTEDYLDFTGNPTNDLNNTLTAGYTLAANADDDTGNFDLTNSTAVTYMSSWALFDGSTQYLHHATFSLVSDTANRSFSVCADANLTTLTGSNKCIVSKGDASAQGMQFMLNYEPGPGRFVGTWYHTNGTTNYTVTSAVAVSAGVDYHVQFWYDQQAAKIYISVNGETPVSASVGGSTFNNNSAAEFRIGSTAYTTPYEYYLAGKIRRVRVFRSHVFTREEREALYNGGTGIDYPFADGTGEQWTEDGAVMGACVRDIFISGSNTRDYVNDTHTYNLGRGDDYDAINLYSAGAKVQNVWIDNFRGTALRLGKGYSSMPGLRQRFDHEIIWGDNIVFQKVHRGIRLDAIDAKVSNVSGNIFRDYGIWAPTGAAQIEHVHLYGGAAKGIWIGGLAASGNSYLADIECENCLVGLQLEAQGSVVSQYRSFECWAQNAYLIEGATLSDVVIDVYGETVSYTDIVGVEIAAGATESTVTGIINVNGTSTGIELAADRCRIDVAGNIDGGAGIGLHVTGTIDDCDITINFWTNNASAVALKLDACGVRNRIRVNTYTGTFTNPIVYPGGGTTYNLSLTNEVWLNGVPQHVIGHHSGGGTVTQGTSKGTGVTIHKKCGNIVTHNANLVAGTAVFFIVTNSFVTANSIVLAHVASGAGSVDDYEVDVGLVTAGAFTVILKNVDVADHAEALTINFIVLQGSTS